MGFAAEGYFFESPRSPLVRRGFELAAPGPSEAIVQVLACGLCHTDLSFRSGAVPTKLAPPIVLGHEVVGRVVAAGEGHAALVGRDVLVPSVLPCGDCGLCRAGRGNACAGQKMPGNDIHGGFATHLLVPAAPLVSLADFRAGPEGLCALSVVADAVSTAYQAVRRSGLAAGGLAVVVGAGGVGGFVAQIAHVTGARVIAIDVSQSRLDLTLPFTNKRVLLEGKDASLVRKEVRAELKAARVATEHLCLFECSGTASGQSLAYALLERAATLVMVGYTPDKVEVRLSNLMAFDATVHGTWSCPPEVYPAVLRLIEEGRVALAPFVETAPMSEVDDLLRAMDAHQLQKRMVLDPSL